MFRLRHPALLALLALLFPTGLALGQEVIKGKSVKAAPKPAVSEPQNKGFDVRGPEVVKTAKTKPVKLWEVDQEGPSYGGDDQYFVGVESVVLYSDGRMRWTFYLSSKGEKNHATDIAAARVYVADKQGETYRPIDMQIKPNREGHSKVVVQAGTKERVWFDFPAPKKGTDTFRVGFVVEDFFLAGVLFKPFTVKLVEPISAVQADPVVPPPLNPGGENPAPVPGVKPAVEAPPQALKDVSEKGQRYEGTIKPKAGARLTGSIQFDKKASKGPISARLFRSAGPPAGLKIIGRLDEEGMSLVLSDVDDVDYTFTLEGTHLLGTDTAGNVYNFTLKP